MIKKTSLAWISLGSFLLAQQITQIEFQGLVNLSPNVAKNIVGLKVGEELTKEKVTQSIKNFYSQGYFRDVWVENKGNGALVYHFEEKLAVANIEIKGYGTTDANKQLLDGVGLKKGDFYDSRRVQRAKEALISKIEKEGYYNTIVEVTTKPVGDSSVAVVFDVNKGEKIKITKLNLIGASKMKISDLDSNLVNKQADFLGWLPFRNTGSVNADQLEYDAYRLKDAYMKHGYLDAEVSKPLMRVDFSSYTAEIDYQVKEGNRYKVGDVIVTQSVDGLNSDKITKKLLLKKGKVFDIERMRKDIESIKNQVGDLGYAFADVAPQINKDEKNSIVNVNYVVVPGQKVTINDVLISGNDSTQDRVVRRYIYLAPGDTYSLTDLKQSRNALGRTGFFEDIDVKTQRVSEDTMNLLVNVKEAPTGSIAVGGGYGSYEKLMFNASLSERNLFGTGIAGSVGLDISKISTNYNLSFTNPRLWDSLYSLSVNLFKRNYEYFSYDHNQLGGSVVLGREFLRHFYVSSGLSYIDNKSEVKEDSLLDDRYKLFYNDKYKKLSGLLGVSFDNTDDYYVPREGFVGSVNLEYAQVDGTLNADHVTAGYQDYSDFSKFSARFGAFYGLEDLIDYDLILRYKARFSMLNGGSNTEYIPIAERLYLGGIGSVRGYEPYSISPTAIGGRIGGTKTFSNSIEASIPISKEAKMRLTFFLDHGIIDSSSFNTADGVLEFDSISRSSGGAAIEWNSPFGPINFVFAKPISPEPGDRTSSFEFTMGTKF